MADEMSELAKRIRQLEMEIKEQDKQIMTYNSAFADNNFAGLYDLELGELRKKIDDTISTVKNLWNEYYPVFGESYYFPIVERCLRVASGLLNKIDAEFLLRDLNKDTNERKPYNSEGNAKGKINKSEGED